jgi:protein gp37
MTTAIEWTDETWNPVTGCDKVSPGCDNCYAETLTKRWPLTFPNGFKVTLHPDRLDQPLHWRKPRRVFVNSMSDLFHPDIPDEFIEQVFDRMLYAAEHTYQVLTKRPQRMARWVERFLAPALLPTVLSHIWLGTSIESDRYTFRADHLRRTPAAVRFLSLEPLLGPLPSLSLDGINWVIVGGESGPGHRPIEADWVRDLRDRSVAAGVPFFFKQWGGRTPKAGGRELDGRTWNQYPSMTRSSDANPQETP